MVGNTTEMVTLPLSWNTSTLILDSIFILLLLIASPKDINSTLSLFTDIRLFTEELSQSSNTIDLKKSKETDIILQVEQRLIVVTNHPTISLEHIKLSGYMVLPPTHPITNPKDPNVNLMYKNVDPSFPKNVKIIITEVLKKEIVKSVTEKLNPTQEQKTINCIPVHVLLVTEDGNL
jgi:hypothetical protein